MSFKGASGIVEFVFENKLVDIQARYVETFGHVKATNADRNTCEWFTDTNSYFDWGFELV